MSDWISIKNLYPQVGEEVLVWFGLENYPYMAVWTYKLKNRYFSEKSKLPEKICVTHWMPLPPPPRETR